MNIRTGVLLLTGLALGVSACHKDKEYNVGEQVESCSVSFALRPDYTVDEVVLTRAVERPADADFSVRLENTRAEVLRTWKYAELPDMIKVVPGSYKLVAYYGSDTVLPAFDTPYYYGETKVTLKDGDNLDTVVRTSVGTVKVALDFDKSFGFDYDDYFVDVKTVGDSLRFLKTETREGYFLPGNLRMRFGLRPRGQEAYYEFYPPAIKNVGAKEFYRMTLKAQSENGALSKISIETDSTTIDIPVDVELPFFFLPKAAPKIVFDGATIEDGKLVILEGEKKNAVALVSSAGGLTELKIRANGVAQSQGWPEEIDLMNATEADLNALKSKGFEWDERITKESEIKSMVWVRFDDAISRLKTPALQVAHSELVVLATDRLGQISESKISLETHPILFAEIPTEGNIWAKRAEMKLKTDAAAEEVYIEYKPQGGNWQRATMEEISRGTDMADYWVKNLNPNQEYAFRACIGDYKSIQEFSFTTEEAAQVPNAGMEEWSEQSGKTKYYSIWTVQGWCTMNELTTSEGGTNDNNLSSKRDGMAYCATSGTKKTLDCNTGSYAALVRSVGWGRGSSVGAGSAGMKKATAGELYLGNYSEGKAIYGIDFAARPASVKFYSKYSPYNPSDKFIAEVKIFDLEGGIIAEGCLSDECRGVTTEYVSQEIHLDYKNYSQRGAKMYIRFVSGTCVGTNKTDFKCTSSLNKDFEYVGAQLYIDDIELIYE